MTICLDRSELAKLLKVSPRTLYRLDDAGMLPAPIALGTSKRWLTSEIEAWLTAGAPPRRAWETLRRAEAGANLRSAVAAPRRREA